MKIKTLLAAPLSLVIIFLSSVAPVAATSVTVNSPANGQTFSGNDFTVSGVADANSTVVLIRNGLTLAQTRSNSDGNWSVDLSGLPDGDNSITVKSIKNTGFGYFLGSTDGGTTGKIHRLKLSDNTIDGDSYPYAVDNALQILLVPSATSNYFYQTGSFNNDPLPPARFNADSPGTPIPVTDYPSANASVGTFSADGTKYYSPNVGDAPHTISVVDVASNTVTSTITTSIQVTNVNLTPGGLLYANAAGGSRDILVINPTTNTVVKTFAAGCDESSAVTTTTFSQDSAYPYYFVYCAQSTGSGHVLRYKTATDELVNTWAVDYALTNGILTLDNSKIYTTSSSAIPDNAGSDKIYVVDPNTGTITKSIQMHSGVLGIFQSPDAQHIYAATPGNNFSSSGIDVVDTADNDSIQHIASGITVTVVTASTSSATISNVNVSVVLGVKTTLAGTLAKTGIIVALASPIGLFLIFGGIYTYWDYRRHRAPLMEAAQDVNYSYMHHLKVVSLPLMKYRLSISVDKNLQNRSDKLSRF